MSAERAREGALVQAVAVLPSTHLETCAAVAAASVLALAQIEDPAWEQWLSGPFTKTVRRVSRPSRLDALRALEAEKREVEHYGAIAVAFAPTAYEGMPRRLRSLQVSGLDVPALEIDGAPVGTVTPRGSVRRAVERPAVWLDPDARMTTGKAAAQTAHALMLWWLTASEEARARWESSPGLSVSVHRPEGVTGSERLIEVRDKGLTEVAPGTVTARVLAEKK